MGEFGSALLNVALLVVGLGLLTALFGLPGMIGGFGLIALTFTVSNVGAVGLLTAVIGAFVFVLVIGMAMSFGEDLRPRRRPQEPPHPGPPSG